MMNILFVTTYYPEPCIGGIERVTRLLGEYFAGRGMGVYCLHFKSSRYDGNCPTIHGQQLAERYDKELVKAFLLQHHIHVVINQSHFFYTPFLSEVAHESGARLITCCHSSTTMQTLPRADALRQARGAKRMLLKWCYPVFKWYSEGKLRRTHLRSFQQSDLTLVLSRSIETQYRKALGLPEDDQRLSHICNPLSFPAEITEDELGRKENVVLVVARLYEAQKKLSIVLRAWAAMHTEGWRLVMVGDGQDRARYEKTTKELRLGNVQFEGVQDSLPYYRHAKLFAMTSQWEGFPMTLLESLQMGCVPVVVDRFPAARDMVRDGVDGILVPQPDTKAFAMALQSLMDDEGRRLEMAYRAVESSRKYQMKAIGEQWMKIFNRMENESKD